MKQTVISFILALLPIMASADANGTCGSNLTWSYVTSTNTLTISGTGKMSFNDYDSEARAPWYSYRESIKNAIVKSGVTSIGNYAFYGCSSLTSFTIPNSVTSIGESAFYKCSGLTSIEIPNSVTSIGIFAFCYCSGLTSVTIPNSMTSIGNYAFEYCSGLTSVTIPNSVTSIGGSAFYGCSGLTAINVEEGNTKYDSRENCNAIIETSSNTLIAGCKNSTIPGNVTSIGGGAFYKCSGLTSIEIPNSVTSIGEHAFRECTSLISITIPNSVTSIGGHAFRECTSLISITIPNSVTSIGESAFYKCSGLTSIEIPNSVTSIGDDAFAGTAWFNNQPDGLVYAGKFAYRYKGTMPDNTSIKIQDGTLWIANGAFRDCSGLTSVTIPNSVTSIGKSAFRECTSLTSVTIGNSVTSIGNYAFYGCTGLTSVTIPNSVTSIGGAAFYGCSGLTSIEIPNSVTSIEYSAFRECTDLTTITIGNGVKKIGTYAFAQCPDLTDVYCSAEELSSTEIKGSDLLYTETNAFDGSNKENATLHVSESAINAYKTIEPWSGFGTYVTLKCATPTISITNGKIHFACTTEGVTFTYNVTASDPSGVGNDITPSSMKLTVYASKLGYIDSDTATIEIATSAGVIGDLTGDGKVDEADRVELTKIIMEK